MTLDMIKQNSYNLVEVSQNFSRLEEEKNILLQKLEIEKQNKNKLQISILNKRINDIDEQLNEIKSFIIKLLVSLDKLVNEEQNAITNTTNSR